MYLIVYVHVAMDNIKGKINIKCLSNVLGLLKSPEHHYSKKYSFHWCFDGADGKRCLTCLSKISLDVY